ncbi:DNA-binding protein RFX7 [Trichomycterus rosablanca]|uniref:DNA-binding protein RFX7 n=1 Tax=Trichomycterus rosablanca TaxID=2290929 RepID=UPI002F36093A
MADEQEQQAGQQHQSQICRSTTTGSGPSLGSSGLQGTETSALQLKIKNSICKSVQSKVDSILQDVDSFTDIEKLYLYLRLPSGPSTSTDKIEQSCVLSSRTQQMHAFSWIRNHLEEHPETSLPKQEVYDEYKSYCDNLGYHALSAADFGKIMKNVFPNMKARRLGTRGKSKYCYSGLRKKPFIHMPSLPNLDVHKPGDGCEGFESGSQNSGGEDEVRFAACDLVCEWAQKVLSRQFDSVEDLARFLLNSHYISTKSVAALTVMTGSPTGPAMSAQSSAFVPTTDAHSFQPQVKTLASPSIDAKQQLQRKIQKRQQEQKLYSPLPAEARIKRADGGATPSASAGMPCGSPALLSPQPTIGIVVAAVPSPVTVQRSRQLMSPSPVAIATAENKVLPVNFQVVTQTVQPLNRCPKTPQNVPASPVSDRPARQRYAQILPKPATTSAITLRSPTALLITKSSIKTVMPTPTDGALNAVKTTPVSLGPGNTALSTSNTARPASAGITRLTDDLRPVPRPRSGSVAAMPSTPSRPGTTAATAQDASEAGETQHQDDTTTQEGGGSNQVDGALKPRAASVPTPLSKGSAMQSGTRFNKKMLPDGFDAATQSFYQARPSKTTSSALVVTPRDAELTSTSPRKRECLYPDSSLTPVKKVFISEEGEGAKLTMGDPVRNSPRTSVSIRPDSAPASVANKVKLSVPADVLASSECPVGSNAFQTVSRPQGVSRGQWERPSSCLKTLPSCATAVNPARNTSFQSFSRPRSVSQGQWEGSSFGMQSKPIATRTASAPGQALLHPAMRVGLEEPNPFAAPELQEVLWDTEQPIPSQHGTLRNEPISTPLMDPLGMAQVSVPDLVGNVSSQVQAGYFPFNDDDMTQDSIVEELVQMEEQMSRSMQGFSSCRNLPPQSHQAALHNNNNVIPSHQARTSYHGSAHSSTPIHTTEMLGGGLGLPSDSPCLQFAPTTPVDSALGSSCQTPIGTPHSNCSSGVPPSPVECRNPFAFTPINSSITSYHDGSIVSSSPVKPMQRPMATHPDKAKLEWMNNSYNTTSSNSNTGISILPNYQNLVDDQFRKPHAFAIPGQTYQSPVRPHDMHNRRLTPISPVQQQVASMANLNKQEGFAVPAPLDNKSGTFRCRSVSPAVRQCNSSGTPNPNVPRYLTSPFNSPVTPEVLNIFANSQPDSSVTSMAQRSQSVPLNVMMQTEVLAGGQSSSKKIAGFLLSKMDADGDGAVRGLGVNNTPSNYTARMNLSQILEAPTGPGFLTGANHRQVSPGPSAYRFIKPGYLSKNGAEQVAEERNQVSKEQQHQHQVFRGRPQQDLQHHQQPVHFNSNVSGSDLFERQSLNAGSQDFPGEIHLTSELSGSINDLNSLDTNMLFDPSHQQGQYEESTLEELKDDPIFQQICSETANSAGFDWLENKDQATVEMLG